MAKAPNANDTNGAGPTGAIHLTLQGKGGVGKSLVAANLSVALGQAGKRVVLADLDLGASNLGLVCRT